MLKSRPHAVVIVEDVSCDCLSEPTSKCIGIFLFFFGRGKGREQEKHFQSENPTGNSVHSYCIAAGCDKYHIDDCSIRVFCISN